MNLLSVVNQYTGSDEEILEQVKQHSVNKGKLISSEVVTMYLVKHSLYTTFISSDNPLCIATMATISNLGEFNFILDSAKGMLNIRSLDLLISLDLATEEFKTDLLAEANSISYPFENTTLEEIKAVTKPDSWKLVSSNIYNNKRTPTVIRVKILPNATTKLPCMYKTYGRLPNTENFVPLPQSLTEVTIPLEEGTETFYDITLPFDRLVHQYKLELKGPWDGSITEVEYIGTLS